MLIFGTTNIRYLRSDAADNRYRYPISDHISNTISIAAFVDLAPRGLAISCSSNSYTNAHRI